MKVLEKIKKGLRRFDYIWTIIYGLLILCGSVFMPELQVRGGYELRIILGIGAGILIVIGIIRLKKVNFIEEDMLDDYEKLFLNHKLSNEEIDIIMCRKYGKKYDKFLQEKNNENDTTNE